MLSVHIWFLISVACLWKWQIIFSLKFEQPRIKKHPHHSQQQTYQIELSDPKAVQSNVKNYLLRHLVYPPLSMIQIVVKKLPFKLRIYINSNNSNNNSNNWKMQIDKMHICKLNKLLDNMLLRINKVNSNLRYPN